MFQLFADLLHFRGQNEDQHRFGIKWPETEISFFGNAILPLRGAELLSDTLLLVFFKSL